MSMEPCQLHEITNCSYCTGIDQQHEHSLVEDVPTSDTPVPKIPGGPTIRANFPGTCAGCGRHYSAGQFIHHPQDPDGWVVVGCCA